MTSVLLASPSDDVVAKLAKADSFTELAVAYLLRLQALAYKMCHGRCLLRPLP